VLGHIFGDLAEPLDPAGWLPQEAAQSGWIPELPIDSRSEQRLRSLYGDLELRRARAWLIHTLQQGVAPHSPSGNRRLRPRRVIDDLGRELVFAYHTPSMLEPDPGDFGAMPEAGLLASVTGPGGQRVVFDYQAPPAATWPTRLNEVFLTDVHRLDVEAPGTGVRPSAPRSYHFTYQWPGRNVATYDIFRGGVYSAYLSFYETFTGCGVGAVTCCFGRDDSALPAIYAGRSGGDPCFLAELAEQSYVSNMADNIVAVQYGPSGEALPYESETFYDPDPAHHDTFDRAVAQRYGDALATDSGRAVPTTWDTLGTWLTALPTGTSAAVPLRVNPCWSTSTSGHHRATKITCILLL